MQGWGFFYLGFQFISNLFCFPLAVSFYDIYEDSNVRTVGLIEVCHYILPVDWTFDWISADLIHGSLDFACLIDLFCGAKYLGLTMSMDAFFWIDVWNLVTVFEAKVYVHCTSVRSTDFDMVVQFMLSVSGL